MKSFRYLLLLLIFSATLSSCSVWNKVFPPKYGCGTDGRNVGAEKLLSDEGKKKPPKFKG
jgi:hypothetical protein